MILTCNGGCMGSSTVPRQRTIQEPWICSQLQVSRCIYSMRSLLPTKTGFVIMSSAGGSGLVSHVLC